MGDRGYNDHDHDKDNDDHDDHDDHDDVPIIFHNFVLFRSTENR